MLQGELWLAFCCRWGLDAEEQPAMENLAPPSLPPCDSKYEKLERCILPLCILDSVDPYAHANLHDVILGLSLYSSPFVLEYESYW